MGFEPLIWMFNCFEIIIREVIKFYGKIVKLLITLGSTFATNMTHNH